MRGVVTLIFEWVQKKSYACEAEIWELIHKETGYTVTSLYLSGHGDMKAHAKLRRKIKRAYQRYYGAVWYKTLRFF